MTQEVVGLYLQRDVIVGHRSTQIVLVVASQGAVDVVAAILRQQVDGVVELFLGLLPFLALQADQAAHRPGLAVVGVQLQALLQCFHSQGGVFHLQVGVGPHGVAGGILAPACLHRIELGQRYVEVLVLDVTEHAVVPQRAVLGRHAKGAVVVGDGLSELLLLNAGEPSQLIDAHDIRIALDGLRTVALCSCEVVEMIFGHPSQEPGFIEVRLDGDGLIEVLHGEDIVLIIECRPSDGDEAVGVVLGSGRKREQNEKSPHPTLRHRRGV